MIKSETVLTLAEAREILEKKKEKETKEQKEEKEAVLEQTLLYAKRFSKSDMEKVRKLKEELKKLDIIKIKERHIAKIADILPEDAEDLRKIFIGEEVSIDQNEIEKILSVVKKYAK